MFSALRSKEQSTFQGGDKGERVPRNEVASNGGEKEKRTPENRADESRGTQIVMVWEANYPVGTGMNVPTRVEIWMM